MSDAKRVRAGGVRLGQYPAISVIVKRSGMDTVFKNAAKLGTKYAGKCPVPDIKATFSGVDLEVKDLKVAQFAEPKIDYTLRAPNRIDGSIELPIVAVQGPFKAVRRTVFKTQTDGGEITFNVTGVKVSFNATIGEQPNGMPIVASFDCQSYMGPANLNVRKAKENFAIEVMQLAAKSFRPLYNSQVCAMAKKMVSDQVNRLLAKVPNVLEVNKDCAVKYQVKPSVTEDSVQVDFRVKTLTEEVSPFQPAKFADIPCDNAMVVAKISPAVFNDIAYQLYVNKKFEFTINKDSQALLYSLAKLECNPENEACLGNVAPGLAQKYGGDALVEAAFKAVKAPQVDFLQDRATFSGNLVLALNIARAAEPEKYEHEATAAVDVSGDFKVRISKGQLYAQVVVQEVNVKIDEEHNKKWEDKIKGTIRKAVEQSINDILMRGIPLNKRLFGAGLADPVIKFAPGTLQAQTAFDFDARTSSESKEGKN